MMKIRYKILILLGVYITIFGIIFYSCRYGDIPLKSHVFSYVKNHEEKLKELVDEGVDCIGSTR